MKEWAYPAKLLDQTQFALPSTHSLTGGRELQLVRRTTQIHRRKHIYCIAILKWIMLYSAAFPFQLLMLIIKTWPRPLDSFPISRLYNRPFMVFLLRLCSPWCDEMHTWRYLTYLAMAHCGSAKGTEMIYLLKETEWILVSPPADWELAYSAFPNAFGWASIQFTHCLSLRESIVIRA